MSIGTLETRGVSAATTPAPAEPEPEALRVKEAGEGVKKVTNPLAAFRLPEFSPEDYDREVRAAAPAAAAGGVGSKQADKVGSKQAEKLIARAKSFIGTPYKWGGTGPLGFDCSGFTQFLYRELGINLPRVSYQQGNYGKRISIDKLRPGDLVLWDNSSRNSGADHVAIYIGNGQVIHAPKPGDRVKISKLWDTGRAWGVAMNL